MPAAVKRFSVAGCSKASPFCDVIVSNCLNTDYKLRTETIFIINMFQNLKTEAADEVLGLEFRLANLREINQHHGATKIFGPTCGAPC
jgi:hypothetical protein